LGFKLDNMKIEIDTKAKTIEVKEQIVLSELVDQLERLMPDGKWKEYKLMQTTNSAPITIWSGTSLVEPLRYYEPTNPYNPFTVTCEGSIQVN